jgi:anti-sigma28 factor (negative regulator of flagellin synthesis)
MMCQVFPVPRAFDRQRRRWRAARPLPATRSRSGADLQCAQPGRRRQVSGQCCDPHPHARTDKITQLRHAVENGDYRVSIEQIAEKMVREALVALFI